MKKLSIIISTLVIAISMVAPDGVVKMDSAFLRQLQERDSVLIGDRLQYGAYLENVEEGTEFSLPEMSSSLSDSVEVLTQWYVDTVKVHKARKGEKASYNLELLMELTSFEEGKYDLPAISILRKDLSGDIDTLLFDAMQMDVRTMPVDTASYIPHDIREQVRYPLTFSEVKPYIFSIWLLAALLTLIICLILVRKRKDIVENKVKEAPHIVALRKLDAYRGNKYWAPEKQKQFYSGVTDTLREYIAARYDFGAQEMTTAEIFYELKDKELTPEMYSELKDLFENSDFVKFAKMTLPDEENVKVLPRAIRFVTETYQLVLDDEAKEAREEVKEN